MLAIPLDATNTTTLSKLYGQAPCFTLLDTQTGMFSVIKNKVIGKGPKSADFLKEYGVSSTVFYHMGEGVYKSFEKNEMEVYSCEHNEYTIDEIYLHFLQGDLKKLNKSNYSQLLDPGADQICKCGCENAS